MHVIDHMTPVVGAHHQGNAQADPTTLLAGLVRGEADAQLALFDLYGGHVRSILVKLLGPADPAIPDLAQSVFLRAYEGVSRVRQPEALKAWVSQIAANAVREHFRNKKRKSWLEFTETIDAYPQPTGSCGSSAAVEAVYEVLKTMPADLRLAFSFSQLCGFDLQQVADTLNVSYSTAHRRVLKARRRFRAEAATHPELKEWV